MGLFILKILIFALLIDIYEFIIGFRWKLMKQMMRASKIIQPKEVPTYSKKNYLSMLVIHYISRYRHKMKPSFMLLSLIFATFLSSPLKLRFRNLVLYDVNVRVLCAGI